MRPVLLYLAAACLIAAALVPPLDAQVSLTAASEAQLRQALFQASNDFADDGVVGNGPYTITLTANITLTQSLPMIRTDAPAGGGAGITIDGAGFTIDANNAGRVFFVTDGRVVIQNVTILNARAKGGNGGDSNDHAGSGGGGGLGAGAAVFVDAGADVTVRNVVVGSAASVGGDGGHGGTNVFPFGGSGGGGGMGGNGGTGGEGGNLGGGGGGYAGRGGNGGPGGGGGGGEFGAGGAGFDGGGGGGGQQGGGGRGHGAGGGGGGGATAAGTDATPTTVGSGGGAEGGDGGFGQFAGSPAKAALGGGGGGAHVTGGGDGLASGGGGGGGFFSPRNGATGGIGGGGGGTDNWNGGNGGRFGGGGGTGNAATSQTDTHAGGAGGFGGGGGASDVGGGPGGGFARGGAGGFGGGGGGAAAFAGIAGPFAGNGGALAQGAADGGGGAALGGAVFNNGTLTLENSTFTGAYTVTGGATGGRGGAMAGQAFGALGFLMAGATTTANVTGTNTTTLPSDIAGSAGLTKIGTGTLVLAGANTYTGATTLSAGTILVTGSTAASSAVSVASGATLAGNGTIHGTVDIAGGGTLSPGNSPGLINTGTLTMAAGSTLAMDISGTTPGSGYDQVKVTGAVTLGATLALNVSGLVAGSQSFILIDNDGADPVIGTFSGLPEGATVSAGGMSFRITYAGGDGNDVVIRSGADCSTRAIAPLAPGVERLPYNQALVMEGSVGAVTWTLSGALPSGITFGRGVLSGTPTMRGAFALQATATDSVGCEASAALALSISAARRIVAGTGSGDATVRAFNLSGTAPVTSFHVHDAGFTGGVSVAQADTNSDGVPDVITGAGPGGSPTIGVFDGATNALRASFFAFDPAFRGGVEVAAGDVTGDGIPEILAVPGCGGPPVVRAFNAQTGALVREYPVGAPGSCGLHLAAADVTGDGIADLVVGAGPGGLPVVTVIDGVSGTTLRHFLAYADVFSGGVYVAAADLTGDGVPDIVTGAGPGGGPHVRVFDGATGREVRGFFAYDPVFGGGVRVAAGDLDGDGKAEVITAAGPGGGPHVRIFDGATGTERLGLLAFDPSFTGGVFVGAAAPLGRMTVDGAARTIGTGIRIAGWALREGGSGVGTDAIHAWAYPAGGGAPVFVGATTARVARSDVAAVFGGEFLIAGFDFTGTLAPGTYDLVVFARNSVTGNFDQWRVLRVTVN